MTVGAIGDGCRSLWLLEPVVQSLALVAVAVAGFDANQIC